jgi:hypothetical protein
VKITTQYFNTDFFSLLLSKHLACSLMYHVLIRRISYCSQYYCRITYFGMVISWFCNITSN